VWEITDSGTFFEKNIFREEKRIADLAVIENAATFLNAPGPKAIGKGEKRNKVP